ncbi:hypothetical protein HW561_17190 [Rhodobacteraceae bacterium B1Z28]|uniref:Uncharacterized protein n=1 Tax=Ruegeria haliotis TaxID=2747601 RepID=A0ABX2PTN3_9RHOB|nr:hypothetical protein [Ruegeria haliotis]NVO57535.1 hypothetical protein [Ruegeria haliotis]
MTDPDHKATPHFTNGGNPPPYKAFYGSFGLIPAPKAHKRPKSGAALCDSGVLVCIMA